MSEAVALPPSDIRVALRLVALGYRPDAIAQAMQIPVTIIASCPAIRQASAPT